MYVRVLLQNNIQFVCLGTHTRSDPTKTLDYLGIYVHVVFIVLASSPFLIVPFLIVLDIELNPIILIIKHIMHNDRTLLQLHYTIRPSFIIPMVQCCRSLCVVSLMGTIIGNISKTCVDYLDKTSFRVASYLPCLPKNICRSTIT